MSRSRLLRRLSACWLLAIFVSGAAAADDPLPISVQVALADARLPPEALVAWVAEVGPQGHEAPRLTWRAREPVNPASLMKLYSTGAALELLGPAWTWSTPVLATGPIDARGVLHGDLVIQGRGDPTLVIERLWLLLRQLQQRGVREVRGDIVLDGSAFTQPPGDPADFDGDALRPYNVQPDALMLNLKSITLGFVPDPPRKIARITTDVPLAGVKVDARVPLTANDCGNWRGALKADFSDPARLKFSGSYPVACGEKSWSLAYADPASYNARLVDALWRETGGRLGGRVREGVAAPESSLLFEFASPPLASVVRDINKFSNNVMAQQLFLSLGLDAAVTAQLPQGTPAFVSASATVSTPALPIVLPSPGEPQRQEAAASEARLSVVPLDTAQAARAAVSRHVRERTACTQAEVVIDNGSGLSRSSRSSASCLGAWLQALWTSPLMPELTSSLPLPGVDGTAKRPGRIWGAALGRAHLKTGSLRDAAGLAGYVIGTSGRRYVFVAILNHPNANAGRPVLDALLDWTAQEGSP
ncbi:MAG: D-alanyl-D-alanine carboxypeptidase [Methylibium sp.]|uniref:D-alanyl-D-alanine carboxypeptidase/D-alanyl-D-alanine-endopeptidase n=1 Tax=Methylibium sp. TaxID=2067992 RepID=UPI0017EE7013|nr:D-alanyl-D-alanine carboxypeptidase [Methylibium sp.]MBA3597686.1 D-alanyl-D-alanine carboxypeptidase [Methylibium sp.]